MNKRNLSILLLIIANSIFGFSFLYTKTALNYAHPMVLVQERFVLAFIILNLLLLFKKGSLNLKSKPILPLILMGLIQPVLYFIFETYGLSYASTSYAGILIGLLPVFSLVLGKIFLHQNVKKIQVLFVLLSIVGVYFTSATGNLSSSILGTVLLLMSVFWGSLYTVLSSKISNDFSAFERTYMMFLIGSVFFTCLSLVSVSFDLSMYVKPLMNYQYIVSLLFLGGLSSVVTFFFMNYALTYVEVYINGVLANFSTLVSVIAGVLIMKETFTLNQMIGVILILISVICVSIFQKEKNVTK